MASSLSTMGYDRFVLLCNELGYKPETVLSIRFNPNKINVVYTQPDGMPCSQEHQVIK